MILGVRQYYSEDRETRRKEVTCMGGSGSGPGKIPASLCSRQGRWWLGPLSWGNNGETWRGTGVRQGLGTWCGWRRGAQDPTLTAALPLPRPAGMTS